MTAKDIETATIAKNTSLTEAIQKVHRYGLSQIMNRTARLKIDGLAIMPLTPHEEMESDYKAPDADRGEIKHKCPDRKEEPRRRYLITIT